MDLFYVQRFYGEGEVDDKRNNPEREKEMLEKLREKIRKNEKTEVPKEQGAGLAITEDRKLTFKTKAEHRISDMQGKEGEVKKLKKNKRKKSFDHLCYGEGLETHILEEKQNGVPKKKKKKIKQLKDTAEAIQEKDGFKGLNETELKTSDDYCDKRKSIFSDKDEPEVLEILGENEAKDMSSSQNEEIENIVESEAGKLSMESPKIEAYYPILGSSDKKIVKPSIKRTLPKWIAHPKKILSEKMESKISNHDYLTEFSKDNLKRCKINELFEVQSTIIPFILSQNGRQSVFGHAGLPPSDVCVSAPTGSGKTLAYVLPIVQILSNCKFRRLQALIILPSKDLASQVKNVISNFVTGTQLKVGLVSGIKSFSDEQQQLVSKGKNGCESCVDILICTPGRLVDHIDNTEGFTLEHLRFLVIDEADHLLGYSFHNWLQKIFDGAYKSCEENRSQNRLSTFRSMKIKLTPMAINRKELPLQKLLFSATMTHNPEKLAPLKLYKPILFTVVGNPQPSAEDSLKGIAGSERYILPECLEEKMIVCKAGEKPLLVVYFLKVLNYRRVLCFTGSIEATHRLFLVMKACNIKASEFSSTLNQTQRKGILRDFKTGKVDLLVCSDAMSRGMDIEDVEFVISYDPPVNMKTYVHRVGRTARAGHKGTALTILSAKEVYHFKKMTLQSGRRSPLQKMDVSRRYLEPLMDDYESALSSLKESIRSQNIKKAK